QPGDRPLIASRAARIHQRRVAVSEPEHEPVAEPLQGLPVLADNAGRVVHPDVEDPGGDHQLLSHLEQLAGHAERVAAGIRYPHRLVAELLQFPHGIPAGGSVGVVPQFAAPDAYAGDPLDRWCGHDITPPACAAGGWAAGPRPVPRSMAGALGPLVLSALSSAFCWNIGSQGELMFGELTAAARRPCVPAGATLFSRSRNC